MRCSEEQNAEKLLIPKTGGQILFTRMDGSRQTGHKYFEHCRGNNLKYFVIINGTEECTTSNAAGIQNYLFLPNQEKAKLCNVMKMKELRVWKECFIFVHDTVQHASGGEKGNNGSQYHP